MSVVLREGLGGLFMAEGVEFPSLRRKEGVSVGDVLTVRTFEGKDGGVIGRLPEGKVILFNKKSSYYDQLNPNQVVEGKVIYVARTYVIVDPLSPPKSGVDALRASLKALTKSENWEHAVIAEALLYLIQLIEKLREKPNRESL